MRTTGNTWRAIGRCGGMSLVELLIAAPLAALLAAGLGWMVQQSSHAQAVFGAQQALNRDAQFALQRMTLMLRGSRLVLPLWDNPATARREHVREQTVPASAPEPGSTLATAVLAMSLPAAIDLDGDGFADANNDKDGRLDEDVGADHNNDLEAGIASIDDDGDGSVDEGEQDDDDEDGTKDEDRSDALDDDGDQSVHEDMHADNNKDGKPGIAGSDDDGDDLVDEGNKDDDDEDDTTDEDWLDTLAYVLQGNQLFERMPVPWDANADGNIDGRDVVASVIAEGVTRFRVERVPVAPSTSPLVDLTLEMTGASGTQVSLTTRVRVGQP